MDGFPIYGPIDDDGHEISASELDECNGKFHLMADGSGMYTYRYHITADFPYFIGCYRGSVDDMPGFPKTSQGKCTTDVLQGEFLKCQIQGGCRTSTFQGQKW